MTAVAVADRPTLVEAVTSPYTGKTKMKTRPVAAFDGEGIEIGGTHRYTLLTAVQGWGEHKAYSVRDWRRGLSTERCLAFLLDLPWAGQFRPINVSYGFGYDVTMLIFDIDEHSKTALYRSGWVVWRAPKSGRVYYLEYAARHWLFIGEIGPEDAIYTKCPADDVYNWSRRHPGRKWLRIDDAFGFNQVSFVAMLREHRLCSPEMLDYISREKAARSDFTANERNEIERYNIAECALLIRYIKMLQAMCLSEDMRLPGWYGPGAMATVLLQKHGAKNYVGDPPDTEMRNFILGAASGGRIESFMIGLIPQTYNGDIRSAYPHKATQLPNLKNGVWDWATVYTETAPFSVWDVEWQIPIRPEHLMPFPYRDAYGHVWYPSQGRGIVHACELVRALLRYPEYITVHRGLVYHPETDEKPLSWIHDLARLRLEYKMCGDGRHIPLKLGLNSIPGKFWQHPTKPGQTPPFQSFYAAGFITAATRAQVWDYVYSGDADARDVALIATDGVYTQEPRPNAQRGIALGDWEEEKIFYDFLLVRAGIYVVNPDRNTEPLRRTRGFGRAQLDYARAASVWQESSAAGDYRYSERRFVGLGSCAGRGNYNQYASWITQDRHLSYAPEKGIANPTDDGILYLTPPAFPRDVPGKPYNPKPPQDDAPAFALWADMQRQLAELGDQP